MKTKKLVLIAMFIALSFIGANIKVAGTIAFDSMPGFLGAIILGPCAGAIIGVVGHFLTALTTGFPLTLPVHIIIMIDMAITMVLFSLTYKALEKRNLIAANIVAAIVGVLFNGPIAVLMVMCVVGKGILSVLPILSLVSLINIVLALIIYKILPKDLINYENK